MHVSRSIRVCQTDWVHNRHESGIHGKIVRTIATWTTLDVLKRHHFTSKGTNAVTQMLDGEKRIDARMVGRWIRSSWSVLTAAKQNEYIAEKMSAWPKSVMADACLPSIMGGNMNLHSRLATIRWLFNGLNTADR